jgi:alkanesulfonate monooxygenase SsuD/methylene tetrahydromethanopterin reductase-like flavin-dependent oxidoreductase (luciferase family)
MRVGVTLPTFARQAGGALDAAVEAERLGLHGLFMFDHLWPMGNPTRPSLSLYPMLAAVASRTDSITVGTLVARVGLLPDEVVLASIRGLCKIAPGRLIAAVGTGDRASEPENERLGLPILSSDSRRSSLRSIVDALGSEEVECWVGGGTEASNQVARDLGVTLNFWDVPAETVSLEVAKGTNVSWAGPLPTEVTGASEKLGEMREAGASWVVWGWPKSLATVLEAGQLAGIDFGTQRRPTNF